MKIENGKLKIEDGKLKIRISRILRERRLKHVEFAKTLGISANYVSLLVSGRKEKISVLLAKLIESTYGYRADWVLTGEEPVHLPDTTRELQDGVLALIQRMDSGELRAVTAYIRTLNDVREETLLTVTDKADPILTQRLTALTGAQRKVYDLFAQGFGVRQTADALGLSVNTVKTHSRLIYKKLGVSSRKELLEAKNGDTG